MSKKRKKRHIKTFLSSTDYLTKEQVLKILDYLEKKATSRRGKLNLMLFELMVNTGLRSCEVCGLEIRDLPGYHGKGEITVRAAVAKNSRSRVVVIPVELEEKIKKYVETVHKYSGPRKSLFISERGGRLQYHSLYSKIKIIGKNTKIKWLHPHVLRHTYATHLRGVKNDTFFVQDQLGHVHADTTRIYSRTLNIERISQVNALNFRKL